jgi:signal transduction histidine kinase
MPIASTKTVPGNEEFPVGKDDALFLALDESKGEEPREEGKPWKVLVVDDEKEVHVVTRLALDDFTFAGRGLEFLNAYSGAEAKQMIRDNPDTALILLDVVMETDDAGLEVARYVRQELGNHFVRIILRTGQPGMAPERRVLKVYDINDYRAKTELTQDRMFSVVYTALSSYRDLIALARSRHRLAGVVSELEQFAHVATKDLQAPLMDLVGQLQLFQRLHQERFDDASREQFDSIWHATLRLQSVVDDLVTLANMGGQNETRTLTNCETVLDEACESLRPLITARKARITRGPMPTVYASRRQLVQLFQNLISNAIKFQPRDPPQVHIAVGTKGRDWLFLVADKGIGIHPEHQDKIFKVFRQLTDIPQYDGSGIGLAICEKIVRWHGGKIWVESEPGQGSTFYFTLPLSE